MITEMEKQELNKRFIYHPPNEDQVTRYEVLRAEAMRYASHIMNFCPDSRERALALTKLEEAVMWSNAAIARNE